MRRRLRFDLLKTCMIALRGYKSHRSLHAAKMDLRGIGIATPGPAEEVRITDGMYRCFSRIDLF